MDRKKSWLRSVELNNENFLSCSSPVYSEENQERADCIFLLFLVLLINVQCIISPIHVC